ncbi:SDR family NAD(P)-dependent oxidoreductase [Cereibacter johrii]|uniref:NAD(P)-dependent dehydrogenase (Short-subunit alcohol dehydrogenase family) n=1 Tax=Cereibacter johrii TaxID=445629 RepID=A0ABX5J2Q5_9RHOB|nr:glucose 1-dehydrogenase [Cereibacter johrii]ODM43098.1 short-chain dehydrogenase [Cereibacter johrii]PTM75863.1 NAD(P)-dependent dehydrogenase (short-subunit alcohol dehydrogenase family) [Cereibacter johrii]
MDRLYGKTVIVTGGAVGIGRACVERMAGEGAKVAIFDLLEPEGRALADELAASGREVAFWRVDVADEAAMRTAIEAAADRFGGLHVMINNAGISGSPKATDAVSEEEWDRVQAVNVKGVLFGTKHAIPHLRAAGGGSIVNLSSIAGLVGVGGLAAYHASKGAVRLMTKNDAITYAPERIRVNSIHPGYIWTPMVEKHLAASSDDPVAARAAAGAVHPLGHMGEPDDIAWAAVYLASDEAKFVTGAELVVDGGYTAR